MLLAIIGAILATLLLGAGAVVLAWIGADRSWWRAVVGPGHDWPRVAARLATGLLRREDPAVSLRAVRLLVGRAMRRRIDAVLTQPLSNLGRQLADGGVVPRAQAAAFRNAAGPDLAQLCLAVNQPSSAVAGAVWSWLVFALVIFGLSICFGVTIAPKLGDMLSSLGTEPAWFPLVNMLLVWGGLFSLGFVILAVVIAGLGVRRGWWSRWSRRAAGLILLDGMHTRQSEAEQAIRLSALWPQRAADLHHAGKAGDWRALAAASGWAVGDGQALVQALDHAAERRDRWARQLALAMRLICPLVLALPVALCALAVMTPFIRMESGQISQLQSRPLPAGGSPALVIIQLWTNWIEAQVERAEDLRR